MPITPDTKDWTWVTERPCPECGFDPAGITPDRIGPALLASVPRWQAALAEPGVGSRPDSSTWSVLEYAAHVRDLCRVFDTRLQLMLGQDNPDFANWDQDAAAVEGQYASLDPLAVAQELAAAAADAAAAFNAVTPAEWDRSGRRSNGSVFTVTTLGTYFLHDVTHHLHDVGA
ncbi:DinB family protein [Arthrobacter sp. NPDC055138]